MKKIDWESLKENLQQNEKALQALEAKGRDEILKRRALQLALRQDQVQTALVSISVVVFRLGKEEYGVTLTELSGVVAYEDWTFVPEAPLGVLSVMNVRSEILTVYSLRRLLGIPEEQWPRGGQVLLFKNRSLRIGFHVDQVERTVEILLQDLALPQEKMTALPMQYIKGITKEKLKVIEVSFLVKEKILGQQIG